MAFLRHENATGIDADTGLVHSVVCTAANESDIAHAQCEGKLREDIMWNIAMKPDTLRGMAEGPLKALTQICERIKARSRARVEYPFHVIKNLVGYRMVS